MTTTDSQSTAYARQVVRDEREPRHKRLIAQTAHVAACFKAGLYDAAVAMQFIELDAYAYLSRPQDMTRHTERSFRWFIRTYLHSDPSDEYQYNDFDAYAARCGILHTGGALSDLHATNPKLVVWRFHSGTQTTYAPGTTGIAYVSVIRFLQDSRRATSKCLADIMADRERNILFGIRFPRVFFQAGVLPSRDPEAVAELEKEVDATIAWLEGASDDAAPIPVAGHTFIRNHT